MLSSLPISSSKTGGLLFTCFNSYKYGRRLFTLLLVTIMVASSVIATGVSNPAAASADADQGCNAFFWGTHTNLWVELRTDDPVSTLFAETAGYNLGNTTLLNALKFRFGIHKPTAKTLAAMFLVQQGVAARLNVAYPEVNYHASATQVDQMVNNALVSGRPVVMILEALELARWNNSGCPLEKPSIDPTSGPIGSAFTITDPRGRIQQGDLAVFYLKGTNPALGTPADNVIVNPDGTTLSGTVPAVASPNSQYNVSVRPALSSPARFNALDFFVTAPLEEPSITPTSGTVGTRFTIIDPQGRIEPGDQCFFYPDGTSPMTGIVAENIDIVGNTSISGDVPQSLDPGLHHATVRPTVDADSRFDDLDFLVEL